MKLDMSPVTVSIIIPVYNGGEKFRRCLSSVAACAPPPKEVIVVSDGDTDGSWRVAEEYGTQVLRIPTSGGPARARNLGAEKAKGDKRKQLFEILRNVAEPPAAQ